MMLSKKLPVFALVLPLVTAACGSSDDKKADESPVVRPEIPLNSPADLIGTWTRCNESDIGKASTATYTFNADGSLQYESVAFKSNNCSGEIAVTLKLSGLYTAGSGNSLDISFPIGKPEDKKFTTQYRVFSVQGNALLISNNAGPGADSEHRDYDLSANALKLSKVEQ